ncbi:MAG TPA: glycerol-3-phosphate 1-O-acyltransferase PlsY [Candidatus Ozemobacteraceae bacterium]|nr:glycerol-3-phosphate 1-O-acyltransferase PlsY [Candidatus Ozemobacteraceae bacterium]
MSDVSFALLAQVALGGYLLGSIPSAYWFCLAVYRIDIFQFGSKNMGATNVHRVLGQGPFSMVLVLDILKGFFAVLFGAWMAAAPEQVMLLKIVAGGTAVIGHTLSFWVRFRGGKGVATGLGVFLGLAPVSSILTMFVFLVVLIPSGMVSLGSIAASASLPFLIYRQGEGGDWNTALVAFATVVALVIIVKHRANISRIAAGRENKLE